VPLGRVKRGQYGALRKPCPPLSMREVVYCRCRLIPVVD
jgi:hypothetical protein